MVPQQNKGCKHIPDHSRPNSDQIIYKYNYFYSKFVENRGFSIKIAKKFKIVAKALLRICVRPKTYIGLAKGDGTGGGGYNVVK